MNIKLYEITNEALEQYRHGIKGNYRIKSIMAKKKLTRNIMLAYKFEDGGQTEDTLYIYGNMYITVKGNTIVNIENNFGEAHWHEIDQEERTRLNKLLGISSKSNKSKNKDNKKTA